MAQGDYIELHRKRNGRKFDHEEKARKKEARKGHTIAKKGIKEGLKITRLDRLFKVLLQFEARHHNTLQGIPHTVPMVTACFCLFLLVPLPCNLQLLSEAPQQAQGVAAAHGSSSSALSSRAHPQPTRPRRS